MKSDLSTAPSGLELLRTPPRPSAAQAHNDISPMAMSGDRLPSQDDWLTVNAGGTRYEVTKQTLASSGGMLAICAEPEKHGFAARASGAEIKFDRNAKMFSHVLEWLRTRKIPSGLSRSEQHALTQEGKHFALDDMLVELKTFYSLREAKREARGTGRHLYAYIDLIVAEFRADGWSAIDKRGEKLFELAKLPTDGWTYLREVKRLDPLFKEIRSAVPETSFPKQAYIEDSMGPLTAYLRGAYTSAVLSAPHGPGKHDENFHSVLYSRVNFLSLAFAKDPACLMALEKKASLLQQGDDIDWQLLKADRTGYGRTKYIPNGRPDDGVAHAHQRRALAIETLKTLVGRQPTHPDAWSTLAKLYGEAGQRKEAQEASERAAQSTLGSSLCALHLC